MSDVRWLAAVICPQLVVSSGRDDDLSVASPASLATLVLGRAFWRHHDDLIEPLIHQLSQLTNPETIHQAIPSVVDSLRALQTEEPDLAKSVAVALMLCSAAAEIEDYELVVQVLGEQLAIVESSGDANADLLIGALLNQLTLRSRDAGRPYLDFARQSIRTTSSHAPTRTSIDEGSDIRARLVEVELSSAASHFGFFREEGPEDANLERIIQKVRDAGDSILARYDSRVSETYRSFLGDLFNERFRTNTWVFGGRQHADLFFEVLALELAGHAAAHAARKALAVLRLVQAATGAVEVDTGECLRLLRQSGAQSELELALRWLRATGPLDSIGKDARQILSRRARGASLLTPELLVLRDAAELLTSNEALFASQAIIELLQTGVPSNPPGRWQIEAQRLGLAWVCLAALSPQSGLAGDLSQMLYRRLDGFGERSLEDDAVARALSRIAWDEIPASGRMSWVDWALDAGNGTATASVVLRRASVMPVVGSLGESLNAIADAINATVHGGVVTQDQMSEASGLLRREMASTRQQAAAGAFSMGGHQASDLAAAMIVVLGFNELWSDLCDFLLDLAVAREHRSDALDRLADPMVELPDEVSSRFAELRDSLLFRSDSSVADATISPYPAGLRFLAAHGLLTDIERVSFVTELAASSDIPARREGAKTVELLSAGSPEPWTAVLALQLSHDADSEVQSCATRTLARIAVSESEQSLLGIRRVRELLNRDGHLIPLAAIRAIRYVDRPLPSELRTVLEVLASDHPSSLIRAEAEELVQVSR